MNLQLNLLMIRRCWLLRDFRQPAIEDSRYRIRPTGRSSLDLVGSIPYEQL